MNKIKNPISIIFNKENDYLRGWYLDVDNQMFSDFFDCLEEKEDIIKSLRILRIYFEALKPMKEIDEGYLQLFSKEIWYHTHLLLILGLIDFASRNEVDSNGKTRRTKERILVVANSIESNLKDKVIKEYKAPKQLSSFNEVIEDIYNTRNSFAHNLHELHNEERVQPTDISYDFDSSKGIIMSFNFSYERIILLMYTALFKYLGYSEEIIIARNKQPNSIVDLL